MRTRFSTLATAAFLVAVASGIPLLGWYDADRAFESIARLELESPLARALRAVHGVAAWGFVGLFLLHVLEVAGADSKRRWRLAAAVLLYPALLGTGMVLRGGEWRAFFTDTKLALVLHGGTLTILFALFAGPLSRPTYSSRGITSLRLRVVLPAVAAVTLFLAWLFPAALYESLPSLSAWPVLAPLGAIALAVSLLLRLWRLLVALVAALVIGVSVLLGLTRQLPTLASEYEGTTKLRALSFSRLKAPVVLDRPESCLGCHGEVTGLGAHDAKRLGCSVCHLGHPFRPDAEGAHDGMVLVPGNLDGAARTCGRCHPDHVTRVQGSLMARANGIVAVDRFIFGEQPSPDGHASMSELGRSTADEHLRGLCVNCHLGTVKAKPAPVTERSRGGGCAACHVRDEPARTDAKTNPARFVHPGVSKRVGDASCFGCHSRSGRISLAYAGWRDAEGDPSADAGRTLMDGRPVVREVEDVHHAKGLACIDCHTAEETMGDGKRYLHEEEATRVRCTTCHLPPGAAPAPVLANAAPRPDGTVEVRSKLDGSLHVATMPSPRCTEKHHERVACASCHSAWVHRCVGCHMQYDREARRWTEYDVPPEATGPTMGVFERDGVERIEPFVPGMVLTFNPPDAPAPEPLPSSSAELIGERTRFVRAWAFAAPHTTVRAGQSCRACHLDAQALGFGRGELQLEDAGWRFEPARAPSRFDGLPHDAWVGFLSDQRGVTTRQRQRPLNVEEQRRVLRVGACLTCHPAESGLFDDFLTALEQRSAACSAW